MVLSGFLPLLGSSLLPLLLLTLLLQCSVSGVGLLEAKPPLLLLSESGFTLLGVSVFSEFFIT